MKRALPALLEYADCKAKIQRRHYLSLREQGFSADEALYIVAQGKIED